MADSSVFSPGEGDEVDDISSDRVMKSRVVQNKYVGPEEKELL
jgi:hypothetical protein